MQIHPVTFPLYPFSSVKVSRENNEKHTGFKGWNVDGGAILEMNYAELKDLAEYFHRVSDEVLMSISIARNIIGVKNAEESMRAYEKLKRAVDDIKHERVSLCYSQLPASAQRLKELDEKASLYMEKFYDEPAGFDINDPVDYASVHFP